MHVRATDDTFDGDKLVRSSEQGKLDPPEVFERTDVVGQKGTAIATDVIEARKVFGIDHLRSGLCSAKPRGNGSTLHVDSGPLREDE